MHSEECKEQSGCNSDKRGSKLSNTTALVVSALLGKAVSLEYVEGGTSGALVPGEARALLLEALADEVGGRVDLDGVVVAVEELLAALTGAPWVAGTVSTSDYKKKQIS